MPRVQYEVWKPKGDTLDVVGWARQICVDYAAQGYDLTLRQLYYQGVARGLIPNSQTSYNRVGEIVNKARLAGLMDWDHIVDRTRNLEPVSHWESPGAIMRGAAQAFRLDKWQTQPTRVEVWVEKEALAGVVEQAAHRGDVAYFSCRGYVSQSEMWRAARRHLDYVKGGQNVVVLHLGDHDPSGIDMTRDIRDRLDSFFTQDWLNLHARDFASDRVSVRDICRHACEHIAKRWVADGIDMPEPPAVPIEVRRIALNMDQVEEHNPPPNPAKLTDARAAGYLASYGNESWELDALDPATLDALISDSVGDVLQTEAYDELEAEEQRHRTLLTSAAERWSDVVALLDDSARE